jgi:hypothetical protein
MYEVVSVSWYEGKNASREAFLHKIPVAASAEFVLQRFQFPLVQVIQVRCRLALEASEAALNQDKLYHQGQRSRAPEAFLASFGSYHSSFAIVVPFSVITVNHKP